MNASARSSMAKVMSPPAPAPACSRPAWRPSSGATSSRSAVARSRTTLRIASALAAVGALAQLHVDGLRLAVADDLDLHRVARVVAGDQLGQVGFVDDLVAVDRRDHVAADIDLLTLEVDLLVGVLQPGLIGGAVRDHLRDQGSAVDRQVQTLGELRIDR